METAATAKPTAAKETAATAKPTAAKKTAMSAAEKAAKKELSLAKLKLEMAAAKLAYVRATEAYEAAKSGEDIAEQRQKEDKRRTRPPSYRKRLERREKERMEVDSEKTARAEKHEDRLSKADVAVVKLVAAPQVEQNKEVLRLPDVETHVAAAVFCDGCYRRQDASKKLSRVYGLVFCDKCSFAQLYEK
jgi:hypothetical protein